MKIENFGFDYEQLGQKNSGYAKEGYKRSGVSMSLYIKSDGSGRMQFPNASELFDGG